MRVLVLKFILLRTLGAKRTTEIILPAYSGLVAGFAFLYLFLALHGFFSMPLLNLTMPCAMEMNYSL